MDRKINNDPITLTRYLVAEQQQHKDATGDFTLLLSAIQTACKFISSRVRKAGIANLHGLSGTSERQNAGEKRLDEVANEVFINVLKSSNKVAILASSELDKEIQIDIKQQGKYVVTFVPINASSNIDCNITIGSIFGIWRRIHSQEESANIDDLLQSGE